MENLKSKIELFFKNHGCKVVVIVITLLLLFYLIYATKENGKVNNIAKEYLDRADSFKVEYDKTKVQLDSIVDVLKNQQKIVSKAETTRIIIEDKYKDVKDENKIQIRNYFDANDSVKISTFTRLVK